MRAGPASRCCGQAGAEVSALGRAALAVARGPNGRGLHQRLIAKITTHADCWLWTGGKDHKGYGQIKIDGKQARAHRASFEFFRGAIPEGKQLDHLCRNRACIRPDHLEPVTPRENTLRGHTIAAAQAALTQCPRGHRYDGSNLRLSNHGRRRHCRACANEWPSRRRQ